MSILAHRNSLGCFMTVLVIAAALAGCGNKEAGDALAEAPPPLPPLSSAQPTVKLPVQPTVQPTIQPISQLTVQHAGQPTGQPTVQTTVQPTVQPTIQPTPTLFDSDLDIMAGPIDIPLELQIPSLKVNAPMMGVGLTPGNEMDAPKGPIGDPIWHTAFWYRGSGIPGEPSTATIAGHINDPLGRSEIFAHIEDLHPGDLIIIHDKRTAIDIRFIVDQIKVYSTAESSDPSVLTQIFGVGPVAGTGPQPSLDGLSHLTLITCAGDIVNGQFDHHTVVYATRSN